MYNEKVLGDSRIMKRGTTTVPKKVREKLSVKDGDFLTYLVTRNGSIKIKKLDISKSLINPNYIRLSFDY